MNTVRHWLSRNDANHSNRHAEVNGVTFSAFPYQSYLAEIGGKFGASISKQYTRNGAVWMGNIYFRDGKKETNIEHFEDEDRDTVFIWAADRLNARQES